MELLTYTNSAFRASPRSQISAAPLSKEVHNCSACLFQITAQMNHSKDSSVCVFFLVILKFSWALFSSLKLGLLHHNCRNYQQMRLCKLHALEQQYPNF